MRKCFVAFLILALLTAGTVQAAAYSSGAVKTLVSRTLTKVCSAANDNRCLRLVSGASDVLDKTLTAASFLGKTNWLTLALSILLPVVGDYAFELGKKIRLSLTKSNDEVIVTQVEKSGEAEDIPVAAVPGISSTPGYSGSSIAINMAQNGVDNSTFGDTGNYLYHDPQTTTLATYGGFTALEGQYHPQGSSFVSTLKDAQKFKLLKWSTKYLTVYVLSDGIFSSSTVYPDYWYFTNDDIIPYYGRQTSNYPIKARFTGYMSPIIWVKDGIKTSAYLLIGYSGYPQTVCSEGQYFNYNHSTCLALPDVVSGYEQSSDANASVREEQGKTVVTKPNIPFDEWLETLTETEKQQLASTDLLSDFVDKLWKDTAAQLDYTGEPYIPGKITPDLIEQVSPAPPTIGDMLEPINDTVTPGSGVQPGTTLTPDTGTGSLTDPSTGTDTGSEPIGGIISPTIPGTGIGTVGDQNINIDVNLDLGDYPAVNQPTLDEPPTAANILDPIFNLFPSLQNYQVPEHTSECPRPSFEAFGETYEVSAHCDLIEDQRETIGVIMLLLWSICALAIVLKA